MTAVALLALFSATGVGFGWQPMTDGSPRYEYVVQVEPEMLDALADGQSIPIVSEIPADAPPLGRIRVVVGRQALPRQRLATTRLKPAGESSDGGKSLDGVVLTQYTEAPAPRYGAPPAAAPPASAFYDPYTQTPPAAAAASAIPTSGSSSWNGGIPQVADASAAAGPLQRVGAGIQEATEPIRDGLGRIDDGVRNAADRLGDQTRGVLDQLLPNRPAKIIGHADNADPPQASTAAPAAPPASEAPGWNGGAAAAGAPAAVAAQGDASEPRSNWNAEPPTAAAPGAGRTGTALNGGDAPQFTTGGSPPQVRGADGDPWNNIADERLRSSGASAPAPSTGVGSSAPPFSTTAGAGQGGQPGPQLVPPADSVLPTTGGAPMITSSMLDQLATRPLDDLSPNAASKSGMPLGGASPFTPASGGSPPSSFPFGAPLATAQEASAVGGTTPPPNSALTDAAEPLASARSRAAVIVAWVLLTGSAAGNFYLFWSYLDVRTKYRALVRKTARAVGSRFSAA